MENDKMGRFLRHSVDPSASFHFAFSVTEHNMKLYHSLSRLFTVTNTIIYLLTNVADTH